jgi:hypothetical protein
MSITIQVTGTDAVGRDLAKLDGAELERRLRRAVRAAARVVRTEVRKRAREGYPKSFAKTQTRSPARLVVRVQATTPLVNIWEGGGAKPHPIGRAGQLLTNRGWQPRWSEPPFFARAPVQHPGFRASPLWGPAAEAAADPAAEAAEQELLEGL